MFGVRFNEAGMTLVGAGGWPRVTGPIGADSSFHKLVAGEKDLKSVPLEAEGEAPDRDLSEVPCEGQPSGSEPKLHDPESDEGQVHAFDIATQFLDPSRAIVPVGEAEAREPGNREAVAVHTPPQNAGPMWTGHSMSQALLQSGGRPEAGAAGSFNPPSVGDGKFVLSFVQPMVAPTLEPASDAEPPTQAELGMQTDPPPASVALTRYSMRSDPVGKDPFALPVMVSAPVAPRSRLPDQQSVNGVELVARVQMAPDRPPAATSSAPLPILGREAVQDQAPLSGRAIEPLAHAQYSQADAARAPQVRPLRAESLQGSAAMLQQQVIALLRNPSRSAVHVQLDPVELGHVRISLSTVESGLQIQVVTERPETLDLLRKFSAELLRDLTQMGYKDLSMSFSDQRERGRPMVAANDKPEIIMVETESAVPRPSSVTRTHAQQAGVDIRV